MGRCVWRRLGRLFPIHAVLICLALVLLQIEHQWEAASGLIGEPAYLPSSLWEVCPNFLFLSFLPGTYVPRLPSWSLGVEMYLYVGFALWLVLGGDWKVLGLLFGGAVAFLLWDGLPDGLLEITSGWKAVARGVTGFITGVVYRLPWRICGASLWLALLLAGMAFSKGWTELLVAPLCGLLLGALLHHPDTGVGWLLGRSLFSGIGTISLSLYLAHPLVSASLYALGIRGLGLQIPLRADAAMPWSWEGVLLTLVYVLVSLGIAGVGYVMIERPCRQWARTWLAAYRPLGPEQNTQSLGSVGGDGREKLSVGP